MNAEKLNQIKKNERFTSLIFCKYIRHFCLTAAVCSLLSELAFWLLSDMKECVSRIRPKKKKITQQQKNPKINSEIKCHK